jgi:aryl-alcohol dehydrogenase-like predicted oxidoreductase
MIETRPFGRTGHQSTATIFGGAALWDVTQDEANKTLDVLLEYGVNHIDTANSYGKSEERIGPWLEPYRDRFFLASKTGDRTYAGAWEHLKRSLDLLHTDHLDLWQLHFLLGADEWQVAMGPGGALEAMLEAREQGLVRFLGVTGHELGIARRHLESLARFDFDAVLLPYNYPLMQNPAYAADFTALLERCRAGNVAVQTIKALAQGPWGDDAHTATTWYKPFTDPADIARAVGWVLQTPDVFLNTAGDTTLLPRILEAASDRASALPIPDAAMAALGAQPLFV